MNNVKFYKLSAQNFPSTWSDSYKGIFVHLTGNITSGEAPNQTIVRKAGLYFGGELGWEYLTNDTDVANIQSMIDTTIGGLDVSAFAQASIVNSAAATTEGGTFTVNGISETDGKIATDADTNKTTLTAGRGLSIYNATIGHTNAVTAQSTGLGSSANNATNVVTGLTFDAHGHITAASETALTASNIACTAVSGGSATNVQGAMEDLQSEITAMATGMIYKGAYPSTEPVTGNKVGDTYTYNGASSATIHGQTVEPGDTVVVSGVDSNGAITSIVVIERNLDGAVTTADTLTSDKIVLGNGSETVKTSTYAITSTAVADGGSGANTDILTSDAVVTTIANRLSNLDGSATIATESNGVVTIKAGVTEADGIISNNSDSDITLAKVATTGLAEDVNFTVANTGIIPTGQGGTTATVQEAITQLDSRITNANITIDGQVGAITTGDGLTDVASDGGSFGIKIDSTNANGLSVGANGIAMAKATGSTFGTVEVTAGNGLTLTDGVVAYAHNTTAITVASDSNGVVTINGTLTPDAADAITASNSITLAKVATTGAAADVSYAGTDSVTGSEPATVEDALDDLYIKVNTLQSTHTVVEGSNSVGVTSATSNNTTTYTVDLVWQESLA